MSVEKALVAAGLMGLPFSWDNAGAITYSGEFTPGQKKKIESAVTEGIKAAGSPEKQDAVRQADRKRIVLLAASDFKMMPDYPLSGSDRAALAAYRQALRDLPAQKGFPESIEWPALS